jgi:hypothetical protein
MSQGWLECKGICQPPHLARYQDHAQCYQQHPDGMGEGELFLQDERTQQHDKNWINSAQCDNDGCITAFDSYREEQHANGTTHTAHQCTQDAGSSRGSRETLPGIGAYDHHKTGARGEKGERGGWHAMVGAEFTEHAPKGPGDSAQERKDDAKLLHKVSRSGLWGDEETAFHLAFEHSSDSPREVA